MTHRERDSARKAGYKAGKADKFLGVFSDYAIAGSADAVDTYGHQYAIGYRLAIQGMPLGISGPWDKVVG